MDKYINIGSFILSLAKEKGAETAVCSVSESEIREFNVDGNEFSLFRTLFNRYVTITMYMGKRKGSVSVTSFDEAALKTAVENCALAAQSSNPDECWEIARDIGEKHFEQGAIVPDTDKLFFRAKELLDDIKEKHPKIIIEQMIVSHVTRKGAYMTTTGNTYTSHRGRYSADLMFSAHEGEKSTSFYSSDVTVDNLEKPFIQCAMIDKDLTDVEAQIYSNPTKGKFQGTVIFTPACVAGTVFGNICGNFASDSSLLEGTSIWKDKLGQKVADERITVSFKPHDQRIVCGERYTGEGFISEDFDFIKNGRLESFLISQYVANKTGNTRAKNTSGAMIIQNGEKPIDEIIKNVEKGVIIGRFSGGSPGANGEFSGVAKNGFFIENGKITSALSETMISGNFAEMLNNLVDISSETLVDGGIVAPYMAFDGITISGK